MQNIVTRRQDRLLRMEAQSLVGEAMSEIWTSLLYHFTTLRSDVDQLLVLRLLNYGLPQMLSGLELLTDIMALIDLHFG
jgi:hypothetical protein